MKRPKHKIFKHHKHLIRYAVRRAIHRVDVLEPEELAAHLKKADWLGWVARKLKEMK